jgi:hypothetical protein
MKGILASFVVPVLLLALVATPAIEMSSLVTNQKTTVAKVNNINSHESQSQDQSSALTATITSSHETGESGDSHSSTITAHDDSSTHSNSNSQTVNTASAQTTSSTHEDDTGSVTVSAGNVDSTAATTSHDDNGIGDINGNHDVNDGVNDDEGQEGHQLSISVSSFTTTVGTEVDFMASVSGGTPPITYSLTGTVPTGATINSSTGAFSYTPTTVGTFLFSVTATDSASTPAHVSTAVNITVN